jgi:hypothetical protein
MDKVILTGSLTIAPEVRDDHARVIESRLSHTLFARNPRSIDGSGSHSLYPKGDQGYALVVHDEIADIAKMLFKYGYSMTGELQMTFPSGRINHYHATGKQLTYPGGSITAPQDKNRENRLGISY